MSFEKKPLFKSVPTFRNYEEYHDAEQYTRGWNDAMRYIFGIDEKERIFNPYDHREITEIKKKQRMILNDVK